MYTKGRVLAAAAIALVMGAVSTSSLAVPVSIAYTGDNIVEWWRVLPDPQNPATGPGAATPLHFTDATALAWETASYSNADSFDLYRGSLTDLAAGGSPDCLDSELALPEAIDATVPVPGEGFGYMVGARNASGIGTLGATSGGTPRPNALPCP